MSFIYIFVFTFVTHLFYGMDHLWDEKGYLENKMVELHHFELFFLQKYSKSLDVTHFKFWLKGMQNLQG